MKERRDLPSLASFVASFEEDVVEKPQVKLEPLEEVEWSFDDTRRRINSCSDDISICSDHHLAPPSHRRYSESSVNLIAFDPTSNSSKEGGGG